MTGDRFALKLTGVTDSRLSHLGSDLRQSLVKVGISAVPIEEKAPLGTRGDISLIGQLALELLSSSAVVALIECLKAYITRERKLVIKLRRPDGMEILLSAQNIDDPALRSALNATLEAH